MDILLIILGAICLLVGFAGCFLLVLPGPPLSYLGLILLHFTDNPTGDMGCVGYCRTVAGLSDTGVGY